MAPEPYYITTAIPYANADPHIGHAILHLYADVMARYQRLRGRDVYFMSGTDEHGQKMYKTARELGVDPAEHAKQESAVYQRLLDSWNISNSDFIRTTEERHKISVRAFWERVAQNGDIYKKEYVGLYCVGCESFKTEKDLVNGLCPDHKTVPEKLSEENYFFRLSRYQEPLEFLFRERPDFVVPKNRYAEMLNILTSGLEDISISRARAKLPWGIPVPGDDSQVIYVWFDALLNYITALGFGTNHEELFKKYWPGINVVGKEINRFHSLLWPAMLMAAGVEVPRQVAAHGWITVEGQKMSKTVGNVINPLELVAKYPLEAVRFYLMREMPFDSDGNFSYRQLVERYNGDLANGLGNFTNRVLTMIEKYCAGEVPQVTAVDQDLISFYTKNIWPSYVQYMEEWRFDRALETVSKFIAHCDQIISDRAPWHMAKEGRRDVLNDLLYHLAEALRHIAIMAWPIMPEAAEKIITQLGLTVGTEFSRSLESLESWADLTVGNRITKGEPLFPRLNS